MKDQIDVLANFIMRNVPGQPSQSQGAVDTAIRTIKTLQARVRELEEALEDVRQRGRLADHSHWDAQGNAGRACPVCVEQVIVRERVRDALAQRTP